MKKQQDLELKLPNEIIEQKIKQNQNKYNILVWNLHFLLTAKMKMQIGKDMFQEIIELFKIFLKDEENFFTFDKKELLTHIREIQYKEFTKISNNYYNQSNLICTDIENVQSIESGHTNDITCIIFYYDDKNFITCSYDRKIKFFDRTSGDYLQTLKGHNNGIYSMLLMTNGLLVTGSFDLSIKIWQWKDLQNAKCIKTLKVFEIINF